jgi:hypothetical protein
MTVNPPRVPPADDRMSDDVRTVRPTRPIWQAALMWLAGLALLLVVIGAALRVVLLPALNGGANSPSAAEARLSALQTQEALMPRPTVAPAITPTAVPAAVAQPTLAPTASPAAVSPTATLAVRVQPTLSPQLSQEISQAYLRYFQVSADALRTWNPDGLDSVATGDELAFLRDQIQQDRAAGRALDTEVQHSFNIVQIQGDEAEVADAYRDSSVYINPNTGELLEGQTRPSSPDAAPLIQEVYHLHREIGADGMSTWKVERVDRYA